MFLSIKGVFFQAEVQGQAIVWLMPWKFAQQLPSDVDYRVMLTFLEFYEVLLKFVMFKLYHQLGLQYPPPVDASTLAKGAALAALRFAKQGEGATAAAGGAGVAVGAGAGAGAGAGSASTAAAAARLKTLPGVLRKGGAADSGDDSSDSDGDSDEDEDVVAGEIVDPKAKAELAAKRRQKTLFKGLRFFLGREVGATLAFVWVLSLHPPSLTSSLPPLHPPSLDVVCRIRVTRSCRISRLFRRCRAMCSSSSSAASVVASAGTARARHST